jgi:hypothetical protein
VFAGLMAQGVGIWFGGQAFINMGVNLGVLPTKGLTLPLMSYGGSAILMNLVALALVLRVDMENARADAGRARMSHLVVMAAGTGGHVIPGLAVAREMQRARLDGQLAGHHARHGEPLVPPTGIPLDTSPSAACAARAALHTLTGGCACSRPSGTACASCAGAPPTRCWAWAATCAFPAA